MFYALSWLVVAALLALWSLTAWALNAAAVWAISNAGGLSGVASGVGTVPLPDWLVQWGPPELTRWVGQLVALMRPVVDGIVQAAPSLADGITVATWVVWGIGSMLLVLLGAGAHLLVALWHRHGRSGARGTRGAPLTAG